MKVAGGIAAATAQGLTCEWSPRKTLIYGGCRTGKTTALLSMAEEQVCRGKRVAVLGFDKYSTERLIETYSRMLLGKEPDFLSVHDFLTIYELPSQFREKSDLNHWDWIFMDEPWSGSWSDSVVSAITSDFCTRSAVCTWPSAEAASSLYRKEADLVIYTGSNQSLSTHLQRRSLFPS